MAHSLIHSINFTFDMRNQFNEEAVTSVRLRSSQIMNDYYNQNEEEEEEDDNKGPVTKDIVLFVVDYALHGSELFTEIIQSIQRFYQYKAISSRHDYVGLVFYGCQTFANRYNFPNIHVMHTLEPVSVERVLDLDRVLAEYPSNTSELGASAAEDQLLPLANVLQVCLDVFITAG